MMGVRDRGKFKDYGLCQGQGQGVGVRVRARVRVKVRVRGSFWFRLWVRARQGVAETEYV